MLDFKWAIFYGLIQGVSEFLPVSSSGHLALIPFFFELKDPGVVFDLLMHFGTAVAVILYFRNEVKRLIIESLELFFKKNTKDTVFCQNFLIATFFSFLLILIVKKFAFLYGRTPLIIGVNFIVFGILMFISDLIKSRSVDLTKSRGLKKSILIGLSQALAVFPGVSRSGITLTSARFLGLGRLEASRFSFLLSLPVILGSIVFKIPEILEGSATNASISVIAVGVVASFLFGILTIHFFLKLISKIGLGYFSFYRVFIGVLLIYLTLSQA